MRGTRIVNGFAGGVAAMVMLACADAATTPARVLSSEPALVVVGDAVAGGIETEILKVCKVWVGQAPVNVTATLNNAQAGDIISPFTIPAAGAGGLTCRVVAIRGAASATVDYTVTESAQAAGVTTTWTIDSNDNADDASGSGLVSGAVTLGGLAPGTSSPRGAVITFTNTVPPPPPPPSVCTYTKGFYRNHGSDLVIAVDGRTKAQAQAILDATPGKPGSVDFGGDNTLLNLYQQFLTALINLGGDANEDNGPTAVDNAIDAVQAGTSGTGLTITTTLTQTEMSDLINTLSAFNEGLLAGFPHCDED